MREDSQIDFAAGNAFLHAFFLGGGRILRISDFSNNRFFQALENLISKEEYYKENNYKPNKSFKLWQIWRRQLHSWLPIGTIRINYRPRPILHIM